MQDSYLPDKIMPSSSKTMLTAADQNLLGRYKADLRKNIRLFFVLFFFLVLLVLFSISFGSYRLGFWQIIRSLAGLEDGPAKIVVWDIRMPRIVTAVVTGCGLGVSGMAIQSLLRNPLGSPFTLGISQGAAFGASFSIVVLGAGTVVPAAGEALSGISGFYTTTIFAFLGAICATVIILMLARLRRMTPEAIILAGVALSALFTSGTILVQYFATEDQIARAIFWTFGDVTRSGWTEIAILGAVTAIVVFYYMFSRWNFNALEAGEEVSRSLGVHVERMRLVGMFSAALVAALATAFNGVIAFLGLLAPHIGRRLVGSDYRLLVPFSCLIGALLLLAADTGGRLLLGSGTLPVGVLTSFMGAPLFLYLLIKGMTK